MHVDGCVSACGRMCACMWMDVCVHVDGCVRACEWMCVHVNGCVCM